VKPHRLFKWAWLLFFTVGVLASCATPEDADVEVIDESQWPVRTQRFVDAYLPDHKWSAVATLNEAVEPRRLKEVQGAIRDMFHTGTGAYPLADGTHIYTQAIDISLLPLVREGRRHEAEFLEGLRSAGPVTRFAARRGLIAAAGRDVRGSPDDVERYQEAWKQLLAKEGKR
jgi:hypothetical protein